MAELAPPGERWLTFKEAAEKLNLDYGIRVHHQTLERLSGWGKPGAMPSKMNFGKRQVQMSSIVPWLKSHGHIEQD